MIGQYRREIKLYEATRVDRSRGCGEVARAMPNFLGRVGFQPSRLKVV